jgi:hypothetical protein
VGTWLKADGAGLLSYARAMVYWQAQNAYCTICGHLGRHAADRELVRSRLAVFAPGNMGRHLVGIVVLRSS